MLRSYRAELSGNGLVWLETPPPAQGGRRVLVVLEEPANDERAVPSGSYPPVRPGGFADLVGRLQWRGDAVQAQRDLRDAW